MSSHIKFSYQLDYNHKGRVTIPAHQPLGDVLLEFTNFLRAAGYIIPYNEVLEFVDIAEEVEFAPAAAESESEYADLGLEAYTREAMYQVANGIDPMPEYNRKTNTIYLDEED